MTAIVDALTTSHPERRVFEELRAGEVICATVTCGFWDDANEALDSIGRWRDEVRRSSDLAEIARTSTDIDEIVASGRTAILLGFQNTDHFEGRIRYVEMFADLGVRVVQLTYNNQNAIGGSCYEPNDSGLSRFGHEVIEEMNRVGMLVDLSHVGERTSLDTIRASRKPVAVTHANPSSLYPHKRNKSDEVLRELVDNGGLLGLAIYPNIAGGPNMTVEEWADMVVWTVNKLGVENVGIGSDKSINGTQADTDWMRMGRWTRKMDFGAGSAANPDRPQWPDWFQSPSQYPGVVDGLRRKGLSEGDIEKVASQNWLRLYRDVFSD
jgi:membrane dipeptidase